MNEEFLNRIVGLYSIMTEATFQISSRLIIYKDNLLYHSPSIRLSREAVEDLKAYSLDIESHIMSSIIKEFKEEQLSLRPDLKVTIIKGRWEDVLLTLDTYDCIYFDDYVLDESPSAYMYVLSRMKTFVYKVLKYHTKKGSKISFYSTSSDYNIYKQLNCISIQVSEYNIKIPENCKYAKGDKMYIPIFTKIEEADSDIKDKLLPKQISQPEEIKDNLKIFIFLNLNLKE